MASDARLSGHGGEKGGLGYPMGSWWDTDCAEASDSRDEELSRLRRFGSSVESEGNIKAFKVRVIKKSDAGTWHLISVFLIE